MKLRRRVSDLLDDFFDHHNHASFRDAIQLLCDFFKIKQPSIEWYEWIDRGKTIGLTIESGHIQLVHPEHFKTNRKYNTKEQWRNAVLHEFGHYLFWADAERKANLFAKNMETNLGKPIWKEPLDGSKRGRVSYEQAKPKRGMTDGRSRV